jgi:hypothetical protein
MIEQVYRVPNLDAASAPVLQKALEHIHDSAVGITYSVSDSEPTADKVPMGKICVWDNGTSMKLFFRTGKNNVGSIILS